MGKPAPLHRGVQRRRAVQGVAADVQARPGLESTEFQSLIVEKINSAFNLNPGFFSEARVTLTSRTSTRSRATCGQGLYLGIA